MKILIIWYTKIDQNGSSGGGEKYNLALINFFLKKNYEIDFLYLDNWEGGGGLKTQRQHQLHKNRKKKKRL